MDYRRRRVRVAIFIGYIILIVLALFIYRFHPVDKFLPLNLTPRPTQTSASQAFQYAVPTAGFPGVVIGVVKIEEQILAVADWICVDIDEIHFWKSGDYWEGETSPKVEISVNGVQMIKLRRSASGALTLETNETGAIIGAHGFSIESCFQPQDINPQKESNTVLVSLVHNSNTLYSGSWELIVKQ
jgi:hypothetical protein